MDELLQNCTVRLNSNGRQGTGFFVAPGLILTCAHVVKGKYDKSDEIDVFWASSSQSYTAQIKNLKSDNDSDLALLKLNCDGLEHPYVCLDDSYPELKDKLYTFGYPKDHSGGDSLTLDYEGKSSNNDNTLSLKLKDGQVQEGFSGSPLLNFRTGNICGIVDISRNTGNNLGGRAIPTTQILEEITELSAISLELNQQNLKWQEARQKWKEQHIAELSQREPKPTDPFKIYIVCLQGEKLTVNSYFFPYSDIKIKRQYNQFIELLYQLPNNYYDSTNINIFRISDEKSVDEESELDVILNGNNGIIVIPQDILDTYNSPHIAFTYFKSFIDQNL